MTVYKMLPRVVRIKVKSDSFVDRSIDVELFRFSQSIVVDIVQRWNHKFMSMKMNRMTLATQSIDKENANSISLAHWNEVFIRLEKVDLIKFEGATTVLWYIAPFPAACFT